MLTRVTRLSVFPDIPVGGDHLYSLILKMSRQSFNAGDGTVLSSRTADAYDNLALALRHIKRKEKINHIIKLIKEAPRLFEGQHIITDRLVKTCQRFELGDIIRILEASYVKHKIGFSVARAKHQICSGFTKWAGRTVLANRFKF